MDKRKQIGLLYSYNDSWTGGNYYIQNLISSFNTLKEQEQPAIFLYTNKIEDFKNLQHETNYPWLVLKDTNIKYAFGERLINKCTRLLGGKNWIEKRPVAGTPSIVFPNPEGYFFELVKNKIFWIPDFQEHYLPDFFKKEEVARRKQEQRLLAGGSHAVIFSSKDAQKDFYKFYPQATCPTYIVNFAVTHPPYQHLLLSDLLAKYDLPEKYFFCPNQFWAHKNHIVVLRAVKQLIESDASITIAFSGKESDYRNPDHFNMLRRFVTEHDLNNNVHFLGFLDRKEQLKLMTGAIAIIQPSLFEGWSTVVEDCKAMSQFVIASNISVHKEQLKENFNLFDPHNADQLASLLLQYHNTPPNVANIDYSKYISIFADSFIKIAQAISNNNA